jgi:hypothetical protein
MKGWIVLKFTAASLALLLTACGSPASDQSNQAKPIKVRGPEQEQLHTLDAFNLAIALKHAVYDAGFTCKRVSDGGFVGTYENLDMWKATCISDNGATRDWAVFTGPDGSAQVRDCKDVEASGLPACVIKEKPKGSFTDFK